MSPTRNIAAGWKATPDHWRQFLEFVRDRSVDWTSYENAFVQVYGERPPIREVLERCRSGDSSDEGDFRRLFVFQDEDAGNFARFQAKYNMLVAASNWAAFTRGGSPSSSVTSEVCRFMRQILERQRREGIPHAEQRMTLHPRFTPTQAAELLRGMLATYSEYESSDIQPRLAISLPWSDPWPHWKVVRKAALGPNGRLLTGIDFCSLEEGYPPKDKREFFGAVVEVCPISNHRIGGISDGKHHPVRQLVDFGIPFVVGSDDPGIFDTTLNDEIKSAIAISGLPRGVLRRPCRKGLAVTKRGVDRTAANSPAPRRAGEFRLQAATLTLIFSRCLCRLGVCSGHTPEISGFLPSPQ